jgi:Cys-rich protein (TIGR01571 family)
MICQSAEKIGEGGLLMGVLACFVPCVALTLLRGTARAKYDIDGSLGEDALMSWCCGACLNCQLANEIKDRGD